MLPGLLLHKRQKVQSFLDFPYLSDVTVLCLVLSQTHCIKDATLHIYLHGVFDVLLSFCASMGSAHKGEDTLRRLGRKLCAQCSYCLAAQVCKPHKLYTCAQMSAHTVSTYGAVSRQWYRNRADRQYKLRQTCC